MPRHPVAALALIATLLVGGCARGGDDTAESPQSAPPTQQSSQPSAPTSSAPTETAFAGTEIEVAVKNGKVSPSTRRVEVSQGTAVRLLVTSDVADELHVHGYDIRQDLPAGQQATLDFTADQTGVFEIESEGSHLQLVQLEVR